MAGTGNNLELSLLLEDNGPGPGAIVLHFAGQVWRCDTYYLALDRTLLPDQEGKGKIRAVLQRLLEHWLSAIENVSDGSTVYLPYDFSDQYTAWLRCIRTGDTATLCRGWADVEGWSIAPSAAGDYMHGLPDFRLDGPTIQVPMRELIEAVTALVVQNT